MTKKISKRLYLFLILLINVLGTELIVKGIRGSSIFHWPTLRILISSLIISYVLSYILSKLKDKYSRVLLLIFCLFFGLYAYLQLEFFNYLGTYMSFSSSSQAYKVTDYLVDFVISAPAKYYLTFISSGLLLIYLFIIKPLLKKKNIVFELVKDKPKNKFISVITKFGIFILLCYTYFLTLIAPFMQSKYQFEKNIDLFNNPENQSLAIDQFGVTMFFGIDLKYSMLGDEQTIEEIPRKEQEVEVETDYSRIIDDTEWLNAIENERNKNIKQISNYFISRDITPKNEYTGLFKDKNIIFIMMESVSLLGINEEYFPTLYKLWNEGINFTNFYSPRNSCPTGNNEMTAMVGLYTINNSCTANAYRKNTYPHSLFYKFREQGYYASSYHNYIDYYYYRNDIHTNAGSQKYYNANALGIKIDSTRAWPSDTELFINGLPHFIEEEKFVSFMTTVTTHSPYNIGSKYGDKNLGLFDDLKAPNSLKRYYSKLYELDLGLKYLLEELEAKGKLDDTVLILFGDHQPYSLGVKQQVDVLGEEAETNKNIEKTPLIIYNSKTEPQTIDKYVSIIDILPTTLNLFDLDYDPRLYLGDDIFNDDVHHRAIFTDGSWQDEIGFFNAGVDKFVPNDPEGEITYTDGEILEINTEINLRQKMSTLAIKNNYFHHLFDSLNKN